MCLVLFLCACVFGCVSFSLFTWEHFLLFCLFSFGKTFCRTFSVFVIYSSISLNFVYSVSRVGLLCLPGEHWGTTAVQRPVLHKYHICWRLYRIYSVRAPFAGVLPTLWRFVLFSFLYVCVFCPLASFGSIWSGFYAYRCVAGQCFAVRCCLMCWKCTGYLDFESGCQC